MAVRSVIALPFSLSGGSLSEREYPRVIETPIREYDVLYLGGDLYLHRYASLATYVVDIIIVYIAVSQIKDIHEAHTSSVK